LTLNIPTISFTRASPEIEYVEALAQDGQPGKIRIVARGEATFYLRVLHPPNPNTGKDLGPCRRAIIAEEAGGKVSDLRGIP